MLHRFALAASLFASVSLSSAIAAAQTPAPKHCVTVARDPDDAARALAVRIETLLARAPGVRTVADELTRAALRGESTSDPSLASLVALRRQQVMTDADSAPLGAISTALGCSIVTQIAASPSGFVLRRFDAIARTFDAPTDGAAWSDDALRARLAIAPPAPNTSTAASNASAAPVAQPTNTATNSSANATSAPQPALAQPSTSAPRSTTAGPSRPDPRVTTTQPDPVRQQGTRSTPVWAWVVAGVAGAALVGGFIAAQSIGPSVPLVHVSGPGSAP